VDDREPSASLAREVDRDTKGRPGRRREIGSNHDASEIHLETSNSGSRVAGRRA
jgi:hypothetical protein